MQSIISFVTGNWEAILAVFAGAHALALAVVNLTPTPKDDAVLEKVYSVVATIAGLVTHEAQGTQPKTP